MAKILMPKLGLTMTEGLIAEWRVQPGTAFAIGDVLFVVETEKVANEVEATSDGVLGEILTREGETVPVGTPVARLQGDDAQDEPVAPAGAGTGTEPLVIPASSVVAPPADMSPGADQRVVATPLARRIARDENVDLRTVAARISGRRIKVDDVRREVERQKAQPRGAPAQGGTVSVTIDAARTATARRVHGAKRDIPHFYLSRHVEISALQAMREDLNSDAALARISVTHMLAKGLALALAAMPGMNRIWADTEILAFSGADIGIVSETPHGLRIPVIRNVQALSLDDIAAAAQAIAGRASDNRLTPGDVGGGAISISNVGMLGVDTLTPIINPPQAMILGVGAEQSLFRPDANGAPKACREIVLTLACDHRVIDGADAARFLKLVADILEKPVRLMRTVTNLADASGA